MDNRMGYRRWFVAFIGLLFVGGYLGVLVSRVSAQTVARATNLAMRGPVSDQIPLTPLAVKAHAQANGGAVEYAIWLQDRPAAWVSAERWRTLPVPTLRHLAVGSYPERVEALDRDQVEADARSQAWRAVCRVKVRSRVIATIRPSAPLVGHPMTILARAQDLLKPVYALRVDGPDGLVLNRGFRASSSWTLVARTPGSYHAAVWAKGAAAPLSAAATTALSVTVRGAASMIPITRLMMNSKSPVVAAGTPVTFTIRAMSTRGLVPRSQLSGIVWRVSPSTHVKWRPKGTTMTITAPPGHYTITATVEGLSTSMTLTVYGSAAHLRFGRLPSVLTAGTDASETIGLTVTDARGKPVPDTTVDWTSSNPATVTVLRRTVTNAQGQTTVILTAGRTPGTATITARVGKVFATLSVSVASSSSLLHSWGIGSSTAFPLMARAKTLPNDATSAAAWWSDANASLMIQATTGNRSIWNVEPGQPVYLAALLTNPDSAAVSGQSQPTWTVDSPKATIGQPTGEFSTPAMAEPVPNGTILSTVSAFTAVSPGIYVVQAHWGGENSVPLVLVVGKRTMPAPSRVPTAPPQVTGVAEVPASALTRDPQDTSAIDDGNQWARGVLRHIWIGTPVQGWIPMAGQVPASWVRPGVSHTVTIEVSSTSSSGRGTTDYSVYTLPVNATGHFSGIIASPYRGRVDLEIVPSAYTMESSAVPAAEAMLKLNSWSTTVTVNRAVALPAHFAALANVNYTDPAFAPAIREAARIWYNAPDPISGAIAISNWIATSITYNYTELRGMEDNQWTVGATPSQAYHAGTGVCENYTQILTALYRALGIPAVIENGVASSTWVTDWTSAEVRALGAEGDGHAWVAIYGLTASPLMTDPTWDGGAPSSLTNANYLTNAFTTDTVLFAGSHYGEGPDTAGFIFP